MSNDTNEEILQRQVNALYGEIKGLKQQYQKDRGLLKKIIAMYDLANSNINPSGTGFYAAIEEARQHLKT